MSWWKSLAKWAAKQALAWGIKKVAEKPKPQPIKRPRRSSRPVH